jgi:hypothetical protein
MTKEKKGKTMGVPKSCITGAHSCLKEAIVRVGYRQIATALYLW